MIMLSRAAFDALASAAERGALVPPFSALSLGRWVSPDEVPLAQHLLTKLHEEGLSGRALAAALRLAEGARGAGEERPSPVLVWSDLDVVGSRDTSVVCNELFRTAERSVIVSTFSLGAKAKEGEARGNPVLLPLATRLSEVTGMTARLFVNLKRTKALAGASEREVERAFVTWFRREVWPWEPVPEVYYDPRSIQGDPGEIACLHAKCVVVDGARALVTSANLTEAAHGRNIEAGVLLDDPAFARVLEAQLMGLVDRGYVRRLDVSG